MDWKRNGYWLEFKFGETEWIKEIRNLDQNVELKKRTNPIIMLRNYLKSKSKSRKNPLGKIDFEILYFMQNRFENQKANSQIEIQKKPSSQIEIPISKSRSQ